MRTGFSTTGSRLPLYATAIASVLCMVASSTAFTSKPLTVGILFTTNCALLLWSVVTSRALGAASMMTGFYLLFMVGVPSIVQIQAGSFPFEAVYSQSLLKETYGILSATILFLTIGLLLATRKTTQRSSSNNTYESPPLLSSTTQQLIYIFTVLSVSLLVGTGPTELFRFRHDLGSIVEVSSGAQQMHFIAKGSTLITFILVIAHRKIKPSGGSKAMDHCLAFLSLILLGIAYFPPGLARFEMIGFVVAIATALFGLNTFKTKVMSVVMGSIGLFYVFPAVKALGGRESINWGLTSERGIYAYFFRLDFDSFQQIANAILYIQTNELRYGANFAGALLFWIPRSLWPEKPIHSGHVVTSDLGFSYTNVSCPLPAEAYISGKLALVCFVFLIWGFAVGRMDSLTTSRNRNLSALLPLQASVAGYTPIILRGALNSTIPMLASAFVLALVVYFVSFARRS